MGTGAKKTNSIQPKSARIFLPVSISYFPCMSFSVDGALLTDLPSD